MAVDNSNSIHARSPPGVYEALQESVIGIAGCGGLGSNIAVMLARSGAGKLVIADFDRVEMSNLNRQQYFLDDIGKPKTEALEAILRRIVPDIEIETHQVVLNAENVPEIFENCDVICEAFDSAESKTMLLNTVMENLPNKPIICGNGMGGTSDPSQMAVRKVAENVYVCGDGKSGMELGMCAPRVTICAGLMANKAIQILLGRDEDV